MHRQSAVALGDAGKHLEPGYRDLLALLQLMVEGSPDAGADLREGVQGDERFAVLLVEFHGYEDMRRIVALSTIDTLTFCCGPLDVR